VIATLDRLLPPRRAWEACARSSTTGISRATDAAARRALRIEVAGSRRGSLQPDAASERFRAVLADDPGDAEALEALSRLAETGGRWAELAELIATRRDLARGRRARSWRTARALRAERLETRSAPLEAFREVLSLVAAPRAPRSPRGAARRRRVARRRRETLEPEFEARPASTASSRGCCRSCWSCLRATTRPAAPRAAPRRGLRRAPQRRARAGFELLRTHARAQPDSDEVADALTELASRGVGDDLAREPRADGAPRGPRRPVRVAPRAAHRGGLRRPPRRPGGGRALPPRW
jgi:hypothetical protein